MMEGIASLIGWSSCLATGLAVAWSRRPRAGARAASVWVAAIASAVLLGGLGTTLLAAGALAWGLVVGIEVYRDAVAREVLGRPRVAPQPHGEKARGMLAIVGLVLVWLCVAAVGFGTVVRLYVTFGADLSRHPDFGVSSVVLRALFVEQPVLPLMLGLALVLEVVLGSSSAWACSGLEREPRLGRDGGAT